MSRPSGVTGLTIHSHRRRVTTAHQNASPTWTGCCCSCRAYHKYSESAAREDDGCQQDDVVKLTVPESLRGFAETNGGHRPDAHEPQEPTTRTARNPCSAPPTR